MGTVIHPRPRWDFDDATGSEQRFRAAAAESAPPEQDTWLTQVARALGLQGRYDEAHALLDGLDEKDPEVVTRTALERGRLVRSAGDEAGARRHFDEAAASAREAGLDDLLVDALHMLALVAEPEDRVEATLAALETARSSSDLQARDWDASLLNNLGMVHADAGRHAAALAAFEQALEACERIGDLHRIRLARWMVAWSLRNLGHRDEALALQRALRADLAAAGEVDPYVDEEIALLEV